MFKSQAVCYVEAIRNGAVPCIESALTSMTTIENEKAVENALELYKRMMLELPIPASDKTTLNNAHSKCHGCASEQFLKQCVFDDEMFYKRKLEVRNINTHIYIHVYTCIYIYILVRLNIIQNVDVIVF